MSDTASPARQAIEILGGPTRAAEKLRIKRPSVVANWGSRGRIPPEKVIEVESLTGISRHVLRPDVFGASPDVTRSVEAAE